MKKIILIEARSPGMHVFSAFKMPRLGIIVIGTMAKQLGYEVRVYCEDLVGLDMADVLSADLVGVSSITSTAPRAVEIIKQIRKARPDLPIVVGGPHFTFLTDEAFSAGANFVVRHEGEETFTELLHWLSENGDINKLSNILGLSFKFANKIFHNPDRSLIDNLDALPFPDFGIIIGREKITTNIMQLTRGCPYPCEFCSVTKMFGRKVRVRNDIKAIVDEIERLLKNNTKKFLFIFQKKMGIFFYDDNFFIKPELAKEILREIIRRKLKFEFTAQIRIDAARDEEFLSLARQAGLTYCYIGYESINPRTQEAYHKEFKTDDLVRWTKIIRSHGIRIHGMFVFDGDTDDRQAIIDTVRFANSNHLDSVQFVILVPLPGTNTYNKLLSERRIIDFNWERYDGHHVVYQPKLLSPTELYIATLLMAMPNFYSLSRTFVKFLTTFIHLPFLSRFSLRQKIENLGIRLYAHNLLKKLKKNN